MYDQIREDTFFLMFYASVAMLSLIACCYLLFRRANAIAPDVTPPVRLRRWTSAFFAAIAICHMWYLPTYFLTSPDDVMRSSLIAGMLDCMTVIPLTIIVLLVMLQDRRRPLWSVAVMVAPLVIGMAYSTASLSDALLPVLFVYFLLMWLGLIIYMVRAMIQYGHWLRDNYADLEHKEVWQSFVVLAIIMLVFAIYVFTSEGPAYLYAMLVISAVLICYLLWRVETLSDLSISQPSPVEEKTITTENTDDEGEYQSPGSPSQTTYEYIAPLLQKYCVDTQLYLQHDLTVIQLAKAIGTNRFYLSQYFSNQGTTYNDYINGLRINHFMSLYGKAITASRPFTAQQLASESGYRSYNTFRNAFKLRTGQNVREWMSDTTPKCQNQQK